MVYLEMCLYCDTLALQVNWSGAITEVLTRPAVRPYMGVLANVKATVRQF